MEISTFSYNFILANYKDAQTRVFFIQISDETSKIHRYAYSLPFDRYHNDARLHGTYDIDEKDANSDDSQLKELLKTKIEQFIDHNQALWDLHIPRDYFVGLELLENNDGKKQLEIHINDRKAVFSATKSTENIANNEHPLVTADFGFYFYLKAYQRYGIVADIYKAFVRENNVQNYFKNLQLLVRVERQQE